MTLLHAAAHVQAGPSAAITVTRQEEPSLTLVPVMATQGDIAAGDTLG
jgi:hypothetical protein